MNEADGSIPGAKTVPGIHRAAWRRGAWSLPYAYLVHGLFLWYNWLMRIAAPLP